MSSAAPAFTRSGPGLRYRLESLPLRRLGNAGVCLAIVAVGGVLRGINLAQSPATTSDEGVLVQRAWILHTSGGYDQLTAWYDHPPLGWLVLSLWSSLTSAFDWAPSAIAAGRSGAVAAALVTAGLLWVLARRVGLHRWSAALAVTVLAASPLAVEASRQVSLDGLAVPWLVAAFMLAVHPHRPLGAFAGSAGCLAVAVLTNETAWVFAPVLAWQLHQHSLPSTRRYGFAVCGYLFAAAWAGYVIHVVLYGSISDGFDGLGGQLVDRAPSDGVAEVVSAWLALDPVTVVAVLVAALAALGLPLLRPYAVAALLPFGLVLVPGFASPTLVVLALPFGALVVAGTAQQLGRQAGVALVAVAAVTIASGSYGHLLTADDDATNRAARSWIADNVPRSQRVLVDEALWTDLAADRGAGRVAGYREPAADDGWRTYDIVVSTEALRRRPEEYPGATAALGESIPVATFGTGAERIELRRIVVGATADAVALDAHDPEAAAAAGAGLSRNPRITLSAEASADLLAGEVDMRLMTTLVAVAALEPVRIDGFPADAAQRVDPAAPRRTVELRAGSVEGAEAVTALLRAQAPPYRPVHVDHGTGGRLTISYIPATLL